MMRSALRLASSACSAWSIGTKISATRDSVLPTLARIAGQRVVDLGVRDVDLGPHLAADDLDPGDLRLDLLGGDLVGHADALQILLELAVRHAGGAFDLADALGDLAFGRLSPSRLASWICSRSSIIWRRIWGASRWRSSGLSCRPVRADGERRRAG